MGSGLLTRCCPSVKGTHNSCSESRKASKHAREPRQAASRMESHSWFRHMSWWHLAAWQWRRQRRPQTTLRGAAARPWWCVRRGQLATTRKYPAFRGSSTPMGTLWLIKRPATVHSSTLRSHQTRHRARLVCQTRTKTATQTWRTVAKRNASTGSGRGWLQSTNTAPAFYKLLRGQRMRKSRYIRKLYPNNVWNETMLYFEICYSPAMRMTVTS